LRRCLRFAARGLFKILTRAEVNGRNHLPARGPAILAGNHIGIIEVAMLVAYTPHPIELVGAGDIPLDPNFAWIANLYGFIPIRRGILDREGLYTALGVLTQAGIVGVFPEGGIWTANQKPARSGIAWLSAQAKSPVIPIGFGGMNGALRSILSFKRPAVTMNIGEQIPPVTPDLASGVSRKASFERAATEIMARIDTLLSTEERQMLNGYNEAADLRISLFDANGNEISPPDDLIVGNHAALGKFLTNSVLLDVFARNLHMSIQPFLHLEAQSGSNELSSACQAVLDYLEINPGFFTYRFGVDEGLAVAEGLRELQRLANWSAGQNLRVKIGINGQV
jgi:1-acyl-sn-glycerol-3-phosphate acyltransferase